MTNAISAAKMSQTIFVREEADKFPAHLSAESPSNISPTRQKSYPKFRNPRTTFEIFKKKL